MVSPDAQDYSDDAQDDRTEEFSDVQHFNFENTPFRPEWDRTEIKPEAGLAWPKPVVQRMANPFSSTVATSQKR